MNLKQLREKINALPAELDELPVYVYSHIDEGGDSVSDATVNVGDDDNLPYFQADPPWKEKDKFILIA